MTLFGIGVTDLWFYPPPLYPIKLEFAQKFADFAAKILEFWIRSATFFTIAKKLQIILTWHEPYASPKEL